MSTEYSQPPFLAEIYYLLLLGAALVALVQQVREDKRFSDLNPLPAWQVKKLDAFFFVWAVVVACGAIAMLVHQGTRLIESSTWRTVSSIAGWQVGVLAAVFIAIRLWPKFFSLDFSPQKITWWCAAKNAVIHLLAVLPLLICVALLWSEALKAIERMGLGDHLRQQEILDFISTELPLPALIAMVVTAVVLAPIMEELLFRGLLYRLLKAHLSARIALIISSVAFGLIHFNALSLLPLTLLGMAFARSYERTGSLKVPILMHALFNANSLLTALLLKPEAAAEGVETLALASVWWLLPFASLF